MSQDLFVYAGSETRDPLLTVLKRSQQYNVRIKSVDGRVLTDFQGSKIYDFASCNYLGFDLDQDSLMDGGIAAAKSFGMHTSSARLIRE